MKKKRHTTEEIIKLLREAGVGLSGLPCPEPQLSSQQ
jgi:hypothetical protein